MIAYRYPLIAHEGWLPIGFFLGLAALAHLLIGPLAAVPLWLSVLFVGFLFRDPARKIPPIPLAIVGPVDGRVVSIDAMRDPLIDRDAIRIVLEMKLFNVFTARSPMEGKVLEQWFGRKPNGDSPESQNKLPAGSFAQWVQSDEGDDVTTVLKPSSIFQRPRCYVHSGERIGQGQRCGIVPFGSMVEVFVPANSHINVHVGNKIRAGCDTIATLVH